MHRTAKMMMMCGSRHLPPTPRLVQRCARLRRVGHQKIRRLFSSLRIAVAKVTLWTANDLIYSIKRLIFHMKRTPQRAHPRCRSACRRDALLPPERGSSRGAVWRPSVELFVQHHVIERRARDLNARDGTCMTCMCSFTSFSLLEKKSPLRHLPHLRIDPPRRSIASLVDATSSSSS